MATVAGILRYANNALAVGVYIRIAPFAPPDDGSEPVISRQPILVLTHPTTGAYSFTLIEGRYRVNVPATPEFRITVPAGDETYDLGALTGYTSPVVVAAFPWFPTITEAQNAIILGDRVDVLADANGEAGVFFINAAYTGPIDGVNAFQDSVGTIFERVTFT